MEEANLPSDLATALSGKEVTVELVWERKSSLRPAEPWDEELLIEHLVERINTDTEYENERTQQRDAIDAAAAKSKEDAATLQRINGTIESVRITSMGRDKHAKTDEAKSGLRKWRDQLAKAKAPLATIEYRIRAAINKIYDAYENGQSYSKPWESGGAI